MSQILIICLVVYLVIMNLTGFILMGADKSKARKNKWRIPEKTFFIVSILGGSLGTWLGMYAFRHKTRHWYFAVFMPFIFVVHVVIATIIVFHR